MTPLGVSGCMFIYDTPRVTQVFCPDTPNGRCVVKPGMMEMEMEIERTLIALTHTSMCTKWGRESNHAHLLPGIQDSLFLLSQ